MVELYDIDTPKKTIKISKTQSIKDNIVFYGIDNDYPETLESLIDNSETANLCVKTKTKFLATKFTNENIGKTEVGKTWVNKSYTLNAFVRDMAYNLAKFNGCYIAVTKNLDGKVVNVSVLDFIKCRFTEFDSSNRCNAVYVGDFSNTITGKKEKSTFSKFPLFNGDKTIYKMMAETYKTTTSIYPVFIDTTYYYSKNSFESVAYDMATESEIQINRYEEISQGSPSKLVIRTDFSKEESKRQKQIEQIKDFAGSKGNRVLIIKSAFDESGSPINNGYQIDTIADTRNLDQFTTAETAISGNIRKALQIPSILVAPNDGATLDASSAQLKVAVDYYNDLIRDEREIITETLDEIFSDTVIDFGSNKDFTLNDFAMTIRENNLQ